MTFKAQFLQDFAADRLHHSWKGGYVNNNPNISHGILHSNLFFFKSNMAYHVITDLFKYPNQPSNISISLYTSSPKFSCPPVMSYLCANPKDSISTSSATSPHQIPMVLKTHWVGVFDAFSLPNSLEKPSIFEWQEKLENLTFFDSKMLRS